MNIARSCIVNSFHSGHSATIASLLLPVFSLVLAACAGQIEPGGGPIDAVPPKIIRTEPDSAATSVRSHQIELVFSKYVDRLSVQQSVFVSPYVGDLEFDWSGTTVRITFSDSLRKNTTYVVNVGTDVKDLNAGNRMSHGFTLAFTTGDSIDIGAISGNIFDEHPEGIMLFAYKVDDINPDTLNPTHTKPDFIQQTGKDGTFLLSHLSLGTYRVMAVRDEYRNLVYDRQIDEYGVWRSDVVLSKGHPTSSDVWLRMTKEDTVRPFLTAARNPGKRSILIHGSEALDTSSFAQATFTVLDTLSQRVLPLTTWYIDAYHTTDMGIVTAASLDSGRTYRIFASGLRDLAGNSIDSLHGSVDFAAGGEPDTLRPSVHADFADSTKNVPGNMPIVLSFSERPSAFPLIGAIQLVDSAGRGVPFDPLWRGGVNLLLIPTRELLPSAWYRLAIVLDSLKDFERNGYRDSTLTIHFRTFDSRSTGLLEGAVYGDTTKGKPIIVTASSLDITPSTKKSVNVAKPGPFAIDRLPEGHWTLDGFVDIDQTGKYHYGLPFPFNAAAPFGVSLDTVKVRARWGVQGVKIELR